MSRPKYYIWCPEALKPPVLGALAPGLDAERRGGGPSRAFPHPARLAALARVSAAAHGDQGALPVIHVDVHYRDRAAGAPHARGSRDRRAHRRLQIVDADV